MPAAWRFFLKMLSETSICCKTHQFISNIHSQCTLIQGKTCIFALQILKTDYGRRKTEEVV